LRGGVRMLRTTNRIERHRGIPSPHERLLDVEGERGVGVAARAVVRGAQGDLRSRALETLRELHPDAAVVSRGGRDRAVVDVAHAPRGEDLQVEGRARRLHAQLLALRRELRAAKRPLARERGLYRALERDFERERAGREEREGGREDPGHGYAGRLRPRDRG